MKDNNGCAGELCAFQKRLGYSFRNLGLLSEALTHSSYANELGLACFNERLEFLGDAVLELVVSEMLYTGYPNLDEGQMTVLRSRFVCKNNLCERARLIGLAGVIKLGKSLKKSGVTDSMLADAMEAVFGAVFLEDGYLGAKRVIEKFLDADVAKSGKFLIHPDPKTELQEKMQAEGLGVPYYKNVERKGPDHALQFRVEVMLRGEILASAWGSSIKDAEFKAAEKALSNKI